MQDGTSKQALLSSLEMLDAHLAEHTYLVGESISLAEVTLISDLLTVFEAVRFAPLFLCLLLLSVKSSLQQ